MPTALQTIRSRQSGTFTRCRRCQQLQTGRRDRNWKDPRDDVWNRDSGGYSAQRTLHSIPELYPGGCSQTRNDAVSDCRRIFMGRQMRQRAGGRSRAGLRFAVWAGNAVGRSPGTYFIRTNLPEHLNRRGHASSPGVATTGAQKISGGEPVIAVQESAFEAERGETPNVRDGVDGFPAESQIGMTQCWLSWASFRESGRQIFAGPRANRNPDGIPEPSSLPSASFIFEISHNRAAAGTLSPAPCWLSIRHMPAQQP